jgi:inner membrane transporter RhtA
MISIQYGATYAKHLFPLVGAEGATALRLGLATLILVPILRPWRARPSRSTLPALLGYGAALGGMNLLFYLALARIPLGIAVALEFTGPLALAIAHSRRWTDLVWTGLAVTGLLFLLPIGHLQHALDPLGILFALGAGVGWALYATLGKKAGSDHGWTTTAIGTGIGALLTAPFGLAHAGMALFTLPVLRLAIMVAIFSSALPFSLEMVALTRLPTRVYGTLTSVEPALGALAGFAFLNEELTLIQMAAVAAIMCASLGTAATMQAVPAPTN